MRTDKKVAAALWTAAFALGGAAQAPAADTVPAAIQAAQDAYAGGNYSAAAEQLREALQELRVEFARRALPEELPGFTAAAPELVPMRVPGFAESGGPLPVKATRSYTREGGKVDVELIVGRGPQRDNPFLRLLQQKNMIQGQASSGESEVAFGTGKATVKTLTESGAIQIEADAGKMASLKLTCSGCKDSAEAQGLLKSFNPALLAQSF